MSATCLYLKHCVNHTMLFNQKQYISYLEPKNACDYPSLHNEIMMNISAQDHKRGILMLVLRNVMPRVLYTHCCRSTCRYDEETCSYSRSISTPFCILCRVSLRPSPCHVVVSNRKAQASYLAYSLYLQWTAYIRMALFSLQLAV